MLSPQRLASGLRPRRRGGRAHAGFLRDARRRGACEGVPQRGRGARGAGGEDHHPAQRRRRGDKFRSASITAIDWRRTFELRHVICRFGGAQAERRTRHPHRRRHRARSARRGAASLPAALLSRSARRAATRPGQRPERHRSSPSPLLSPWRCSSFSPPSPRPRSTACSPPPTPSSTGSSGAWCSASAILRRSAAMPP